MRAALFLLPTAALAARTTQIWREKQQDQSWSYMPDPTADWYKENDLPLPKVASVATFDGTGWYVKLECLECPFRVRKLYEVVEEWQEPAQDNSLLLNFTLNADMSGLLLNGDPIVPLESRPPAISAFQIPANTSHEIMMKMIDQRMMDRSWVLGTKYGRFELQYEYSLLATEMPGEKLLQFDVTGVHIRSTHNPRSYSLKQDGQKLVQIRLGPGTYDNKTLGIYTFEVVERKERQEPQKMPCGRPAMIKTEYDPREWDYYGKIGTWSRAWRKTVGETLSWADRNGLFLIILSVVFGVVSLVRWRQRRAEKNAAAVQIKEDSEAALLAEQQYDDAPPEYSDVPPVDEHKEDTEVER